MKNNRRRLGSFFHWGVTASCFCWFFSFFAIYSIALKLHTLAFQSDWCFLFILRIRKKKEEKNTHVYPLPKIASLCWSHDNNQTPSHPLIIKVVSACSAICKHPRTRPEVQRLFSLLYPGYNTTNRKINQDGENDKERVGEMQVWLTRSQHQNVRFAQQRSRNSSCSPTTFKSSRRGIHQGTSPHVKGQCYNRSQGVSDGGEDGGGWGWGASEREQLLR